ncbi:hypothetical protein sync_2834 [Synechococcus sp. CC9311]|nr:hypothetical protein sync_2834 [Synechococcus sp. CC9311]
MPDQDSQTWKQTHINRLEQTRVRPMGGFHCHGQIGSLAII